jgi:hypothetical protein
MSANSKSKSKKRNRDNIENDDDTEVTTVPDKGEICKDNKNTHVGNIGDIENIKKYIKDNILWYISPLDENIRTTLFNENDEGLLKYIKLIISDDNVEKEEINTLLISILDAIQVDQAHDFLDGSSRSMSSYKKGNILNLSKCLGYPQGINLHKKIEDIFKVFENKLSNVKIIKSGDDISDIKYSIRDTGVRDDFSKKIVSNTKQVVAIASIIDSAGCSQTNRNMPAGIDKLELIITNIGYIFYQSFYKWFRMNNIVTLINIDNETVDNFINDCNKKYSIEFHIKIVDSTSGISTQKYKKIYTQTNVIPGCNGDFTVNKIVNILYKTPIKCCKLLYQNLYNTFKKDDTTKQIVMTYYVLNKGFGDFSQMFSCLYFNNRKKYGIVENIHYKNIILCTVDRFLAYISHLCKCPFILGASYTCRYYSCDTNSKYYGFNIIEAYNNFNNLKLTKDINDINDISILLTIESNKRLPGNDYKSKLINSKQSIISEYYKTHFIFIDNEGTDVKLSSYKITKNELGSIIDKVLSYSLKLNDNKDLNTKITPGNFSYLKEKYDNFVLNDCKSIAESEIFSNFILENYTKNNDNMYSKVQKVRIEYNMLLYPTVIQQNTSRSRRSSNITKDDNSDFRKYKSDSNKQNSIGLSTILEIYVKNKVDKLRILQFFISYFEDIKNNVKLLENHLKKLYIIIDKNKELNVSSSNYINEIIKKLKDCLHFFINEIKTFDINVFKDDVSSIIKIYTDNPYYNEGFESILSLEGFDMTKQYNPFILQYDIFKNIKTRFEKLNFEYAFHNATIAYYIAFGKLRLIKPSIDKPSIVSDVSLNIKNVKKFISIMKEKTKENRKKIREIEKKDDDMEEDDFKNTSSVLKNNIDLDQYLNLDFTEEEINLINIYFIRSIEETEKEEAKQEQDEFINNTGIFEYNCDDICEVPNTCFLSNDGKKTITGGNINENKILNRYIQRIILIKYNINKLIKSKNNDKNIKKMYKQINDIKIKIHNIKEKDKINKKNKLKAVKEDNIIKQKALKEAKIIKQKAVKDAKIIKQKHVKNTKVIKQKPVKDTKVKKSKPEKDTKVKKPKPEKDSKSKSPKPEKDSKSKSPKPEKDSKTKSPKL